MFKNNKIEIGKMSGAKVGVSVPASGVEGNEFKIGTVDGVERVFEVREPQSLISQLGLPPDTQREDLAELLRILRAANSSEQLIDKIKPSNVWQKISQMAGAGIDLTRLANALWGLKKLFE
jgi:hypothetical protein